MSTETKITGMLHNNSQEMLAKLLLPAGVTSKTSILYKAEGQLLDSLKRFEHIKTTRAAVGANTQAKTMEQEI